MKNLYLVRHAKSNWGESALSDFDRPLNDRGNLDKIKMGEKLVRNAVNIDLIISSSSTRTKQTSFGLAEKLEYDLKGIRFEDELYHSSAQVILSFINDVSDEVNDLMIVAHNPGISFLCNYLCDYSCDFPTLGAAKITFEQENWKEVSAKTGVLEWFDFPKLRVM